MVITTGTAGGIGTNTQLGDVFVVTNAKFNCTKTFAQKPWAQQLFAGPPPSTPRRPMPQTSTPSSPRMLSDSSP